MKKCLFLFFILVGLVLVGITQQNNVDNDYVIRKSLSTAVGNLYVNDLEERSTSDFFVEGADKIAIEPGYYLIPFQASHFPEYDKSVYERTLSFADGVNIPQQKNILRLSESLFESTLYVQPSHNEAIWESFGLVPNAKAKEVVEGHFVGPDEYYGYSLVNVLLADELSYDALANVLQLDGGIVDQSYYIMDVSSEDESEVSNSINDFFKDLINKIENNRMYAILLGMSCSLLVVMLLALFVSALKKRK